MNIKKLYFALVSLISLIVLAISLGIIFSSILKFYLISNKEYLVSHNWELKSCEYDVKVKFCQNNDISCLNKLYSNEEYKASLKACKTNREQELLLKRNYNLKITLIQSVSTFIVFSIIFTFHYLRFRKID